jgi:superfamily II DNA or RNA helicase
MIDLSMPAHLYDYGALPRALRRKVERLARRRTVGQVLERLDGVAQEAVHVLLERQMLGLGEPDLPRTPASRAPKLPAVGAAEHAWFAWAEAHHIADVLSRPYNSFISPLAYSETPEHVLVVDVLSAPVSRRRSWTRGWKCPSGEDLRQMLLSEAELVAQALVDEEQRRPQRERPPAQAALTRAWRLLSGHRAQLRKEMPPRRPEGFHAVADMDELRLGVWFHQNEGGTFDLETGALDLEVRAGFEVGAVDVLLDWMHDPAVAEQRQALAAAVATPRWQRMVTRLAERVPPRPMAEDEDKPLLGFQVDPELLGVEPVQCRPKKRAAGYLTRAITEVPEVLAAEPRNRRVLDMLGPNTPATPRLRALAGYPRVFLRDDRKRHPISVREVRLAVGFRVQTQGVRIQLEADGMPVDDTRLRPTPRQRCWGMYVHVDGPSLRFAEVGGPIRRAWNALSRFRDVAVPLSSVDALLSTIASLDGSVPIDADHRLLGEQTTGDTRQVVVLRWEGDGMVLGARVQPLPEAAPALPGQGSSFVLARRGERMVHVARQLVEEPVAARALVDELGLGDSPVSEDFEVTVPTTERALGLIEALQERADIRVVWEGPRVAVGGTVGAEALRLRVSSGRDWFGLSGELAVGRKRVSLQALLRAAAEGHRYVEVGKGHFVSLSEHLRAALAAAASTADKGTNDPQLTALHAPIVEALVEDGARLDAPPEWLAAAAHMREAATLEVELPAGLNAELRPYQQAGVTWLARLAHWAPGAVLADDMGLGKTVQAIALLLRRAPLGPALVVAPTSVVTNWQRELARFAPELEVTVHHGSGRDRALQRGAGQVVVTSYGLLVNDSELWAAHRFATTVLDESQAIKNPASRRAKAAVALDSAFCLALSGTPVQNRVAEIYSLFRYVAPGLLGSKATFEERYVRPIEGRGDTAQRAALAALVAPFLLRRNKGEVATDLPARTDIQLDVDLGDEERALYERLRLEALERIAKAGKRASFQVLEELTRLRKQACHPRLSDPTSPVASAKLKYALRALKDIRDNGHRALVFSTFVTHLNLIRDALEAEGFTCCWLDGSTPMKRRSAEVEAFQGGHGDVFLISLKAGGVGLNLTAATYVLHLDPWWNPAAEDQASDRAHRIGQRKPVTVYRLVSRDTVEAEIVAMHAHKRELAQALLTGAGSAAMPTTEELLGLMAQPTPPAVPAEALPRRRASHLSLVPPS